MKAKKNKTEKYNRAITRLRKYIFILRQPFFEYCTAHSNCSYIT